MKNRQITFRLLISFLLLAGSSVSFSGSVNLSGLPFDRGATVTCFPRGQTSANLGMETVWIGATLASGTGKQHTTLIYQTAYERTGWSGRIRAFSTAASHGSVSRIRWDTDRIRQPGFSRRKVFTYNTKGVSFRFEHLNPTQQQSLRLHDEADNFNAIARLDYIRGDRKYELGHKADQLHFRRRDRLLGDIIHSVPAFAGAENFGYVTLPGIEGQSYPAFLSKKASRPGVLYIGANDGMLHALNADSGMEMFAYVPAVVIPGLLTLTQPDYGGTRPHRFFVDGSQRIGDVYFQGAWETVLVGTTGAGGRAVYALKITDPEHFDASDVLWEFSDRSHPDMGFSMAEPAIARMANGRWAAIVPNGYYSKNGEAVLFVLDIETGALIATLKTRVGSQQHPNGLSSVIPVDHDGDHRVDAVYAGDLQGNLWKFDLGSASVSEWKIAFGTPEAPAPLFVASDDGGRRQLVTAKPQVGFHPLGGLMVYFGTGQLLPGATPETSMPGVQSFYAIRDRLASVATTQSVYTPVSRERLQQQSILARKKSGRYELRLTSNHPVDNNRQSGWYLDLRSPLKGVTGEQITTMARLRDKRVVFSTYKPDTDACGSGTAWLMTLDAATGARPVIPVYDLNADTQFTVADNVAFMDMNRDGYLNVRDRRVVSGKKLEAGTASAPVIVRHGFRENIYRSVADATVEVTTASITSGVGRESWRQIPVN